MKIEFVTPYFYPYVGGLQKGVLRISTELLRMGCEVTVTTSDYVPSHYNGLTNKLPSELEIKRIRCLGVFFEAPLIPGIAAAVGESDSDVLHVNGMYPLFTDIAILAARKHRKKAVLSYHFDPVNSQKLLRPFERLYRPLGEIALKLSDRVVATGSSYARNSELLSSIIGRVEIISNGVDDCFFEQPSAQLVSKLRADLKIQEKEKVILFVGQLKRFKGVDFLISALREISTRVMCKLVIVGAGPDYERLDSISNDLGIARKVVFAGHVMDEMLPVFYHMCDVYCLPSVLKRENFGITLLEAMAAAKPVVASRLPGPDELVEHESNGLLVDPGNARQLSATLISLLTDNQRSSSMGTKAALKARQFTWTKVAVRYLSLYNSCVHN